MEKKSPTAEDYDRMNPRIPNPQKNKRRLDNYLKKSMEIMNRNGKQPTRKKEEKE